MANEPGLTNSLLPEIILVLRHGMLHLCECYVFPTISHNQHAYQNNMLDFKTG